MLFAWHREEHKLPPENRILSEAKSKREYRRQKKEQKALKAGDEGEASGSGQAANGTGSNKGKKALKRGAVRLGGLCEPKEDL